MAYEAVDSLLCCSLYRLNTVASCVNMSHSASHSDHGFFHLHSNTQQRDNSIQCITSFAALYFISESFCGLHQYHIPPRKRAVFLLSGCRAGRPASYNLCFCLETPHMFHMDLPWFTYFSHGGFRVRCYELVITRRSSLENSGDLGGGHSWSLPQEDATAWELKHRTCLWPIAICEENGAGICKLIMTDHGVIISGKCCCAD